MQPGTLIRKPNVYSIMYSVLDAFSSTLYYNHIPPNNTFTFETSLPTVEVLAL